MPKYNPCKDIEAVIRQIVGRVHVGDSNKEVADYAVSRLKKGANAHTKRKVRACAVRLHRENQKMYRQIYRGGGVNVASLIDKGWK